MSFDSLTLHHFVFYYFRVYLHTSHKLQVHTRAVSIGHFVSIHRSCQYRRYSDILKEPKKTKELTV